MTSPCNSDEIDEQALLDFEYPEIDLDFDPEPAVEMSLGQEIMAKQEEIIDLRAQLQALKESPKTTEGMARKNAKWRPSLVPSGTVRAIASCMQAGIDAGHNEGDWRNHPKVVFYDAAFRHLLAWADGEDTDPQSGLPHLAHALASLAIMRTLQAEGRP